MLKDLVMLLFELIIKLVFLIKFFGLLDNVLFEFVIEFGMLRDRLELSEV